MPNTQQTPTKSNGKAPPPKLARISKKAKLKANTTPANKKLRWMVNTPSGVPTKMTITPTLAGEMLAQYNDRNRPLIKSNVRDMTKQMVEGKWRTTPVPIVFSDAGRLTDGQNRLTAVVESGTTQDFWVFFGDDDENFFVFDTGAKRTAGHIFAIKKVKDYNTLAAACRMIYFYEEGLLGSHSPSGRSSLTNEELWNFYQTHQRLPDSLRIGTAFYENRLASKSLMTAVHFICAQKSRRVADEFFFKAATGVGLKSKSEPAGKLHATLIALASGQVRPRAPYIAALAIKAWNAEREGRSSLTRLAYRTEASPDERFPRAK